MLAEKQLQLDSLGKASRTDDFALGLGGCRTWRVAREGNNLSVLIPQDKLGVGAPASRYLLRVGRWAAARSQSAGGSVGGEEGPGAKNRCFPRPCRASTLLFTDSAPKSW